jgi:AcrR family transcriptional regulator
VIPNRQRIVTTAGRRLKQDGIDGFGVATLMKDAGLTGGTFYAYFASKDDLVATAVADQMRAQHENIVARAAPGGAGLEQIIRWYFSPRQRDTIEDGCPNAAPPRRDRTLHRRDPAGIHRRRTDPHRRLHRPPGTPRPALGTPEVTQPARHDGRNPATLPRPGRPATRRPTPRTGHIGSALALIGAEQHN